MNGFAFNTPKYSVTSVYSTAIIPIHTEPETNIATINDILDIAELKSLWGQGIEEPYIALTNIKITKDNIYLMSPDKNPTLKSWIFLIYIK